MSRKIAGKVFIVGAGPGDPNLLTLKGERCIAAADVIVYDRLIDPVLLRYAADSAEQIYVGKEAAKACRSQREIEAILIHRARQGKTVVRLKGGDPFVFGRGGEETQALRRAGVSYEIVPGVSSAIAAPAYAGIPLTHRGAASSVAIVTGHDPQRIKWRALLSGADTVVILMGLRTLRKIMNCILSAGSDPKTPVALIQSGTRISQRKIEGNISTIADLAARCGFRKPAIIVIGEVVCLGKALEWFAPGGSAYAWPREDVEQIQDALTG